MYVKKIDIDREYAKITSLTDKDHPDLLRKAIIKMELLGDLEIIGIRETREMIKKLERWLKEAERDE